MKHSAFSKSLSRGVIALLTIALIATMAMGQDLVIGSGSTYGGTGSYVIKGNITNVGVAAATTIGGTVSMSSTSALQTIGTGTNGAINFGTLNINTAFGVNSTTLAVATAVSTNLAIAAGSIFDIGSNSLQIDAASSIGAGGSLATAAGSTVLFDGGSPQTVLAGFTYNGALTLSGAGAKTMNSASLTTVSQAFSHSGAGALTISSGGLSLTTTGAFAAVNNNGGTLTGGSGAATFNGLLTQNGGNLTSGSGGLSLLAGLTNTSGNITVGAGRSMTISGGQFGYTAGTLSFDNTSTVTYGASATAIVDASYGNLVLNTDAKTWALAGSGAINGNLTLGSGAATNVTGSHDLTVLGNVSLSSNLTKSADVVVFTNASSAVSGTNEIVGSVTRTHAFTATNSYTFNNADMIVTPTAITGSLTSFTISSLPGTPPTSGYVAGNSVDRRYTQSYTGSGFTADIQLAYLSGEYTGSFTNRLKLFENGIARPNKMSGTLARSTTGSFNWVKLSAVADTKLTSGYELGIDDRWNKFNSIAIADWNVPSTWDMNAVPSQDDDVVITSAYAVTVSNAQAALSMNLYDPAGAVATGGLHITSTGSLAVGRTGHAGEITNNNSKGYGITVDGSGSLTLTGGNLTNNGKISNDGAITVQ